MHLNKSVYEKGLIPTRKAPYKIAESEIPLIDTKTKSCVCVSVFHILHWFRSVTLNQVGTWKHLGVLFCFVCLYFAFLHSEAYVSSCFEPGDLGWTLSVNFEKAA